MIHQYTRRRVTIGRSTGPAQAETPRGDLAADRVIWPGSPAGQAGYPPFDRYRAHRARVTGTDAVKEEMWHDQANAGPVARGRVPARNTVAPRGPPSRG